MYQKGFFFKENQNKVKKSFIYVTENELYLKDKGYGFITKENYDSNELFQIPALNSGFIPKDIEENLLIPNMFKVDVDHAGNYKVEIVAENDGSEAQIFLERRRMYYVGNFEGVSKFSFTANVCDVIPEHTERIYSDMDLDITWAGNGLRIHSIEIKEVNCPTIFIGGDSTVTDQPADYPYSPGATYCGWGQMITAFLNEKVAVSNHAHSGLTTESFRKEGHYSIISQYIKPGDYFFMQFGHNDQKIEELREDKGYRENLTRYINEISSQGAFPVIITPLCRNTWKDEGKEYNDLLEKYAEECLRLGAELEVPVLDLHKLSMEEILKCGLEESKKYFHPGDYTHSNDYGAYLFASFVAAEIKRISKSTKVPAYKQLESYKRKNVQVWSIDKEKIRMPKIKGDDSETKAEPYKIAMDRLEEIIRRK